MVNVWMKEPGQEASCLMRGVPRYEAIKELNQAILTQGVVPDWVEQIDFYGYGDIPVETYRAGDVIEQRLPGRPRQYPIRRKTTLELPFDLEAAIERVRGKRGLGAYIVEVLGRDAEIAQQLERPS